MIYPDIIEIVIDQSLAKRSSHYSNVRNCSLATFFLEYGFEDITAGYNSVRRGFDKEHMYELDTPFSEKENNRVLQGGTFETTARIVKQFKESL